MGGAIPCWNREDAPGILRRKGQKNSFPEPLRRIPGRDMIIKILAFFTIPIMKHLQKGRNTMEVKKINLGEVAAGAGKNAKAFLGKTKDTIIKAVDQNGDGSFDFKDVSAMADSIGNAAQNAANAMRDNAEARNREKERKALQPIFLEDLDSTDFTLSKLIRVADIDKKHAESEVCKGSVGLTTLARGFIRPFIISICRDSFRKWLPIFRTANCRAAKSAIPRLITWAADPPTL